VYVQQQHPHILVLDTMSLEDSPPPYETPVRSIRTPVNLNFGEQESSQVSSVSSPGSILFLVCPEFSVPSC
jgi:hypothetical protein